MSKTHAKQFRLATSLMMVVVLLFYMVPQIENAATPSSGSVSPENPTATYKAGPFTVPNVTGTTGSVQCGTATPCDEYHLSVSTPASYGTDHNLKIEIKWPNSAADFDLYVLDANGRIIASSASSSDPETVIMPPASGDYTIRVVPYAPLDETFTGIITLKQKGTNPAPAEVTPPTFKNYAAPDSLPNSHNAGEPSIGDNWNTGSVMYQAYTSTYQVKFDTNTSPATATWKDVSADLPNCTAEESLDPILFTDHQTGRTIESQLLANPAVNSLSCFSDNDGATWTPGEGGGVGSGVDHQTVGGGPFSDKGVGPISDYPHAVYHCSQDIAAALCSTSHDGGLTFNPAVPVYTLENCDGLHGHVKVGPQGTVYLPNSHCGGKQAVAVSTDNGVTWTVRKNPDSTAAIGSDPSVGIGSNGTVYLGYQNGDGHAHIAVSNNQGKTWKFDQDVGAQLGIQNIVFPAVVSGDDDRAAFTFIGTTTGGNYQASDFSGVWYLYVATTYDGGQHWITVNATPNDPVQRGPICTGGTSCSGARNLLDFIDATIDSHGNILVGYADGCTGQCVTSGPNNYDALATIARQSSGKPLFSQYDPKSDLTVSNLSATPSNGSTTLTADVSNIGKAGADNVFVQFLDGQSVIGTSNPISLAPGGSQTVNITWDTTNEQGDHTITAIVDPNNVIIESNESNNKTRKTVTLPQ
ncbi:MAG TPA: CARDB domain-containing protein [Bacillales bacterium]|nr:CARDB domain-containing protein [Bacillales bacterium]